MVISSVRVCAFLERLYALFFVLCTFPLCVPSWAVSAELELTAEERDWIASHRIIRVHNETDWAPFNFAEDGVPQGLSIDFMNSLAERVGLEVEYVTGPSWGEFLEMMKRRELDVMLNIVRTPDREKYLLFTPPYIDNPNTILSRKDTPYTRLEELFGKTVSVPKGFFYEEVLNRDYPQIKVLPLRDTIDTMKAVSFGKADAALGELAVFNHLMARHMMTDVMVTGEVKIGDYELSLLNIATRKDLPILASILTKGVQSVGVEEMRPIQRKWLGEDKAEAVETSDIFPLLLTISIVFLLLVVVVFIRLWRVQGERKAILILLILSLLGLIGSAIFFFNLYVASGTALSEAKLRRLDSLRLVDHLRQTSDDLTRMARTYAVTGEDRFEEYFNRILAIRDGEAPRPLDYDQVYWDHVVATGHKPRADGKPEALESLMKKAGFSGEEFDLLRRAKRRSDHLAMLELRAMNAVKGLYEDEDGAYRRRGAPNLKLAQELLHGQDYHDAKSEIMALIERVSLLVDERTNGEVKALWLTGKELALIATLLGFGGLLVVGLLLLLAAMWVKPAEEGAEKAFSVTGEKGTATVWQLVSASSRKSWPLLLASALVAALIAGTAWRNMVHLTEQELEDLRNSLGSVLDGTAKATREWFVEREQEVRIWAHLP